jgi:hypothetical protein
MREPGFEPELMPWQGTVIPLHYSRRMAADLGPIFEHFSFVQMFLSARPSAHHGSALELFIIEEFRRRGFGI